MNTKYTMIITSEDERYGTKGYGLDYWTDNPWDGLLVEVTYGNTYEELSKQGEHEGLFYQLYSNVTGERISYGIVDSCIIDEIEEYEQY